MTDNENEVVTIDKGAAFGKSGAELLAIYDKYSKFFDLPLLVREVLPPGAEVTKDNVADIYFGFIAATNAAVDVNEVEGVLNTAYDVLGAKSNA